MLLFANVNKLVKKGEMDRGITHPVLQQTARHFILNIQCHLSAANICGRRWKAKFLCADHTVFFTI